MENKEDNDLFFLCSLIEYIARKTKNTKKTVVEKLGKKNIQKIYDLADVYHSENIEKVLSGEIRYCRPSPDLRSARRNGVRNVGTLYDFAAREEELFHYGLRPAAEREGGRRHGDAGSHRCDRGGDEGSGENSPGCGPPRSGGESADAERETLSAR